MNFPDLLLCLVVAFQISCMTNTTSATDRIRDVLDAIEDRLFSDDKSDQLIAANEIAAIAAFSKHSIPRLRELLSAGDHDLNVVVISALWSLDRPSPEHLGLLTESLESKKANTRARAAELLGMLGERALPALSELSFLLKDNAADVRIAAALAIAQLGEKAKGSIPALVVGLRDKAESSTRTAHGTLTVSDACSVALQSFGKDAVRPCRDLYSDKDPVVRASALRVLTNGGKNARPYIPILLQSLRSDTHEVQVVALDVLGELRFQPEVVLPRVADLLDSDNLRVRIEAVKTISRFNAKGLIVIDALVAALEDRSPSMRGMVAEVLGGMGPAAKDAIPALHRQSNDASLYVDTHGPRTATKVVKDSVLRAIKRIEER